MPKRKKTHENNLVRGPNGKGSFRERPHKRKDGSQCLRWSGYIPAYGKRFPGSGATIFEAAAEAQKKIDLYENGLKTHASPSQTVEDHGEKTTLSEFIESVHFKSLLKNRRKESSMRRYRDMARHICSFVPEKGGLPLGERPIADVKYALLEEFMDEFRNRPRKVESDGDNYAADVRTFLKAVYTRAYNHEVVARNYAASLPVVPRPSKKHLEVRDSDIRKLFQSATNPSARAFLLLVYEGLTISEALGVMADQIEGNKIHIRRQVTRVSNPNFDPSKPEHPRTNPRQIAALTGSLKRKGRERTIHLTDETMRILMASLDKAKTVKVLCDGK
jgi:integrase